MKAYLFDNSGEAYDACQCLDALAGNGHALVIPSEGVVGLSYAWPVAVSANFGKLHYIMSGGADSFVHEHGENKGRPVFPDDAMIAAVRLALDLGLEIQPAFAQYVDAARALEAAPVAEQIDWSA